MLHDPDSISMRQAGDVRTLLLAGRTFVMQVAHPLVGAGVHQHSSFERDPWRRLREISRSGERFLFHGRDAARAEGARLRALHRDIAGVTATGERYHALEPRAYGWVHTVFLDTTLTMHALYGDPLTDAEQHTLFDEWREGGLLLGLRDRDLPRDLAAYRAFWDDAVAHTLEYNPVVATLLRGAAPPPPDPLAWLPRGAWSAAWDPIGRASRWLTLGALPAAYRARLAAHHPWTDRDQGRFERLAGAIRATVPRLPRRLRTMPRQSVA